MAFHLTPGKFLNSYNILHSPGRDFSLATSPIWFPTSLPLIRPCFRHLGFFAFPRSASMCLSQSLSTYGSFCLKWLPSFYPPTDSYSFNSPLRCLTEMPLLLMLYDSVSLPPPPPYSRIITRTTTITFYLYTAPHTLHNAFLDHYFFYLFLDHCHSLECKLPTIEPLALRSGPHR